MEITQDDVRTLRENLLRMQEQIEVEWEWTENGEREGQRNLQVLDELTRRAGFVVQ